MIGDTAIFRNREAERSRVQNHPRSGTGRPSYSEARPPESENPHGRRHTIVAVHADTIGREPEISRRFSSRSFDCETERHAYFRRSEVVFVSPAEIPAAPLPYIAFVVRPQIAQSRRSLDAPTLSDRPYPYATPAPYRLPSYRRSAMPRNFTPPTLKPAYRKCTPRKCPSERQPNQ